MGSIDGDLNNSVSSIRSKNNEKKVATENIFKENAVVA